MGLYLERSSHFRLNWQSRMTQILSSLAAVLGLGELPISCERLSHRPSGSLASMSQDSQPAHMLRGCFRRSRRSLALISARLMLPVSVDVERQGSQISQGIRRFCALISLDQACPETIGVDAGFASRPFVGVVDSRSSPSKRWRRRG